MGGLHTAPEMGEAATPGFRLEVRRPPLARPRVLGEFGVGVLIASGVEGGGLGGFGGVLSTSAISRGGQAKSGSGAKNVQGLRCVRGDAHARAHTGR